VRYQARHCQHPGLPAGKLRAGLSLIRTKLGVGEPPLEDAPREAAEAPAVAPTRRARDVSAGTSVDAPYVLALSGDRCPLTSRTFDRARLLGAGLWHSAGGAGDQARPAAGGATPGCAPRQRAGLAGARA